MIVFDFEEGLVFFFFSVWNNYSVLRYDSYPHLITAAPQTCIISSDLDVLIASVLGTSGNTQFWNGKEIDIIDIILISLTSII